jgi:hypothetical protein
MRGLSVCPGMGRRLKTGPFAVFPNGSGGNASGGMPARGQRWPRIRGDSGSSTPFHRDGASSVVGRPTYEMAYRSIDGQPELTHA